MMKLERFSIVLILLVFGILLSASAAWASNEPAHRDDPATRTAPLSFVGRLLFAPSIDADGDPASNPAAGVPVPVIDLAGEVGGIVVLAAQLEPNDSDATPIGVPVTFRVWDAQGIHFEETARSDAWGAASAQVVLRGVGVEYSYQASAPGYGETEVRRFRFDPAQAGYTLHLDGAQLWYWRQAPGRVLFTLRSPVPLEAERDEVTLQIVRRPADTATWQAHSSLQPAFQDVVEAGLGLPFPEIPMQVVGTYTATVEVQLPPGDYGFIGSLAVNTSQAEHFFSQPLWLEMTRGAQNQADAAIWASPLEHEPGRRLVQYRAPDGRAIFDLVDSDQLPQIGDDWEGENLFVEAWRTGPFEWQEERYQVRVETVLDDGKKVVSLAGFDYDPILRRYTLAIESLRAQTVTDTLRVDVLGPGGVVIKHEEAQVVLEAGRVLHYSVEVPAELGQPEGLRLELDDPLIGYVNGLAAAAKKVASAVSSHGSVTFQVKSYVKVLGVELLSYTMSSSGGGGWKWPDDIGLDALKTALWDLLKAAGGGGLALGTVGVDASLSLTADFSIDKGKCPSDEGLAEVEARLKALAGDLNSMAGELKWGDPVEFPAIPLWWILKMWASGSGGVKATVSASELTLKVGGQAYVDIAGNVGIKFVGWGGGIKAAWWIIKAHWTLADIILTAAAIEDWKVPQKPADECEPEPPDGRPPDDRQDVWQGIEGFYQGQTYTETIDNLVELVERAQGQNLWRAERLLTLRLRETELARFSSDMGALDGYLDEVDSIAQEAEADLQGLISGTLPISPSATLTEALVARTEQAMAELEALPYAQDQQLLLDAVDVAEQLYLELKGEELELQHELRALFAGDTVGVVASGFAEATLSVLQAAGLPSQLVSPWPSGGEFRGQPAPYFPPDLAARVLVMPSGGLHAIAGSPEARAWLEEYVAGGGLLVVFTQAFGADWAALPGGQVTGVGYEEDQRCAFDSVKAARPSNWLVWMGVERPDIQVDGAFTAWPPTANVLLQRTGGRYAGYPAMIEYPHGEGQVLATVAYGDWAWQAALWWGDEWQMTRSVLIRAWLLAHGQDVSDTFAADPASTVEVSFPFTNTGTFTTTALKIEIPVIYKWVAGSYVANVSLALAPGAGTVVSATLPTPRVGRGVHGWTQVGLYRLKVSVSTAQDAGYTTWGPFVYVRSPVVPSGLVPDLRAEHAAEPLFRTVAVTATVWNYTAVTRTVVVRGRRDLPAEPVTLTVPPGGQAEHSYSVWMDGSKNPSATFYDEDARTLGTFSLVVDVAYPQLRATPLVPPALTDGAVISLDVTNVGLEPEVAASAALTLTAPSGAPVWTAAQGLPPLAAGQTVTPTFTLTLPAEVEFGAYRLWYRVEDAAGLFRLAHVPLPNELALQLISTPSVGRVREPLTLTARVFSVGRFDLAPAVSISVPVLGLTATQQVSLPVGAEATLPITATLPDDLASGVYAVEVTARQGAAVARSFSFVVPPSDLAAELEPGPYRAGAPLTVTLTNAGGVDTVADYAFKVGDWEGRLVATCAGTQTVPAGAGVAITISLPAAAGGGDYRMQGEGHAQDTGRAFSLGRVFYLEGIAGEVDARTEWENYLVGEEIRVVGGVTATAGTLSGTLDLQISRVRPPETRPNERVNTGDEVGAIAHVDPAITVDADGNAYAVWEDQRQGDHIYFAYRPVTGTWGANVQVDDIGSAYQSSPDIAVDGAGNAYAVWYDRRDGNRDIYFAYRPVTGTWGASVRVNDDTGTAHQFAPAITVDGVGNAYAVWRDQRNGDYDIYFAYRPVTGTWSANVRVNDDVGTADQYDPAIAVDAAGNAYAVWQDRRSGYDVYFATRPVTGTWSANVRVNDQSGSAGYLTIPAITVDATGNAYAVWDDDRNGNYDVYFAARPVTGTWSANERVNDDAGTEHQTRPSIAVDADGNAYAVWDDTRDGNHDIYFATRPVTGTWSANERADDDTGEFYQYDPDLAVDGTGNAYAVWIDGRNDGVGCDIYFAARPVTGTWSANVRVNDDSGGAERWYPDIAANAAGHAYAVWMTTRHSGQNNYYDLHFAYRPVTATWETSVRVNDEAGTSNQFDPAIAVDAAGNAYAVWQDDLNGNKDIYFDHRSVTGTWSVDVQVNDDITGTANQYYPAIAVDADGDAYAVWQDYRNGNHDIYFAYRPAEGAWSANALVNDDAGTAHQYAPAIAVDADGNAYAVWRDFRNGDYDIYFAYRPAGGTWGANVRVNDDAGTAGQGSPSIAVDTDGNAHAVWEDYRNGNGDIYFAYRPAGGTWGANVRVDDDTGVAKQSSPDIAVDAAGNTYAVWCDERNGNYDVFFASRPAEGEWSANALVNDQPGSIYGSIDPALGVDAAGNAYVIWEDNRDPPTYNNSIYSAIIPAVGAETVWQREVAVHTAATQAISETVGTLPPGKYRLSAALRSEFPQTLARSRYDFYVFPAGVELTLETDRDIHRPGQVVQVAGRVTNTAALTATLPLTVTAGEQTLLTRTLTLAPGEGSPYSTTLTATEDVVLVSTAGLAQVAECVVVAAPQVTATLEAPAVVGRDPFSVTVVITNTGLVSVTLAADFGGQATRTATLESGEVSLLQATLAITQDTLFVATLSGDVALTLTQTITQGEVVTMALTAVESKVRAGPLTLPYTLTGEGLLPVAVELSATMHSAVVYTYSQSLVLLPGQVYAGELLLEPTPGAHRVSLALYDTSDRELTRREVAFWAMETDTPEQPDATLVGIELAQQPVGAGETLTVTLTVHNEGAAGPVIVGWQAFDPLQQAVVTLTDALTQTYGFALAVPADAPSGTYVGQASLDGRGQPFTLTVAGVDVGLALALDRPWYLPGDVVSLTATLAEGAGLSGDYNLSLRYLGAEDYVTVTVLAGQVVQHTFNFTATKAGRGSVTLSNTPSGDGQRIITIDSLPVEVVDSRPGVYLTHARSVYDAGDTLYLTATITGTPGNVLVMGPMESMLRDAGFLIWQAPTDEDGLGLVLTGTYLLSYTFPLELRSGRYTFLAQADGQQYAYPVDVRGWSVTSRRVRLDKPRYAQRDELAATVEFVNEGTAPIEGLRLSAWIAPPGGEQGLLFSPPVSHTVDLAPGLNVFTITGAFSTTFVGPHRLVVNVGPGCCGWRVAGAAAQLDVGWAHLVELTTDHGDYAPGEAGTGRLDVHGYGPTHLVVTATNGVTLLDQIPDLTGYDTLTFTIPTTPTGDYLLVAHSSDRDGNIDSIVRAYAVPGPRDEQPPTLTLTYPNTDTIVTTAVPTTTIDVTGNASDDSGQVTVSVNGQMVTPTAGGLFTATLQVRQGLNMVSATALDASGNVTYTPIVPVYLIPARGVAFSADRTEAEIGERVTWQTVLTSSGVLSDVLQQQALPSGVVTDVVAFASRGEVSIGGLSPARYVVEWRGDLTGQPITVTVEARLQATGTLETSATVYWGWGFIDARQETITVVAPEPAISLNPTSLGVTLNPGDTATRTLTLHNPGEADLIWNLSELPPQTWLSPVPLSGTLSPSNTAEIAVSFDAGGLAAGVYTSTLRIDSNVPNTPSVAVALTVTAECVSVFGADFVFTPTAPVVNETLTLTGTVVGGTPPVLYTWDLGDGHSRVGQTITHAYGLSATYPVVLIATNCGGAGSSAQRRDIGVATREPPVYTAFLPIVLSMTMEGKTR